MSHSKLLYGRNENIISSSKLNNSWDNDVPRVYIKCWHEIFSCDWTVFDGSCCWPVLFTLLSNYHVIVSQSDTSTKHNCDIKTVQGELRQITTVCRVEKYLYSRSQLSLSLWKLLAQTSWGSRSSVTAAVASHHRAEQDTVSPGLVTTPPHHHTTSPRQGK